MRQPITVAPGLDISPRSAWADADPTGPLEVEADGDVRFLIVHHTASSNDYGVDDVPGQLRSFHRFHTGPEKGWPDIAYNFMVDRFGGVWEARAGSIDQPVKGSATGGSQGFALLCCLVGNHDEQPPTAEAVASLSRLLGWLADRYRIALGPEETATFVSRGSNRWAAGVTVTTPTVSGHRAMSSTTCPGDHVVDLIDSTIVPAAAVAAGQGTTTTTIETTTTTTPTSTTTASTSTSAPLSAPPGLDSAAPTAVAPPSGSGDRSTTMVAVAGVVVFAVVGGLVRWRRRTID